MRPAVLPDSMGEQYLSLSLGPGDLLVQGEVHPVCPRGTSEAPNLWDQCSLEWWQYYLPDVYSQVRFGLTAYEQLLIATGSTRTGSAFY